MTGIREVKLRLNGGTPTGLVKVSAASAGDTALHVGRTVFLNGTTDYVEALALQNSGGALNTDAATNGGSSMIVRWVSS